MLDRSRDPLWIFIFMHLAALSKVWPGVGEGTAKIIYNRKYYIENNGFGTLPNFKQQEKTR